MYDTSVMDAAFGQLMLVVAIVAVICLVVDLLYLEYVKGQMQDAIRKADEARKGK
jgi:Tfp pilus assembly protein PilE